MPQIREQIAMVHLPPSKTLKYLFHVRKTKNIPPQRGGIFFGQRHRNNRTRFASKQVRRNSRNAAQALRSVKLGVHVIFCQTP